MNTDEETLLLGELENLVGKQIEHARRGSYGKLLQLAGQCETLVAKIKQADLLEKSEHKGNYHRLSKLYKNLHLLLSAQQNAATEQLNRIRKGKKMLCVYQSSFVK